MSTSQFGIAGVVVFAMLGTLLWILRAGVKHFLSQQALLQKHLDGTTVVLAEIRDAIKYAHDDMRNGRSYAVSALKEVVKEESDRVIDTLKGRM